MARNMRKVRQGRVTSNKMDKTIVVRIERIMKHPLYERVVKRYGKFYAHDEKNEAGIGDVVRIMETRPMSALKRWRLASGAPQEVRRVATFFGLSYWKDSGQIIHALVTAVVDPQGKVYKVYRGNDWQPTDVLDDIKEMKGA